MPAHSLFHDFFNRSTGHRQHGSPASHGFDENKTKRLIPLNGEEQSQSISQQLALPFRVNLSDVLNELAIDVRLDLFFPVLAVPGLNFPGNLQRKAALPGDLNGQMGALGRSNASEKYQIRFLLFDKFIAVEINSVMNSADLWHGQLMTLKIADGHIKSVGIVGIE